MPRLIGIAVFLACVLALHVWGVRQDRAAGAPFEVTPPEGFNRIDRALAAAVVADGESANGLTDGGAVYLRYGTSEEDSEYTEVVEVAEDQYPLRTGEPDRRAMFDRKAIELSGQAVNILDSQVTEYGGHAVIVARAETLVGGKPVRLTRYALPTDVGRAVVDAFCLVSEEAKYRPQYDAMIGRAKGVAHRPAQLAWYLQSAICAAVALVAMAIARAAQRSRAKPAA